MTTRRSFLKAISAGSAAGGAGIATLGHPRRVYAQNPSGFNRIAYRELGATGCLLSEIGMGCMNMRDADLVRAAIDLGINHIDTAWYYMHGANEQVIGEVMKTERDKVFLTTKLVLPENPDQRFVRMMEESLTRLRTDHVDLLLLHAIDNPELVLHDGIRETFAAIRDKGQARFLGVSTHANHAAVMDAAVESGLWEAVLVGYNYMSPPEVVEAIARTRRAGLGIIAMKNLLNPVNLETWQWDQIADIRKDREGTASPAQALIKWVLEDPHVDCTIPGMTSFEQLEEDVAIMGMNIEFGRGDKDSGSARRNVDAGNVPYCRGVAGCSGCEGQCPKGVRISELNRCLRYACGYDDLNIAWENYRALPRSSKIVVCADCGECVVKCRHGLNLTGQIELARGVFG